MDHFWSQNFSNVTTSLHCGLTFHLQWMAHVMLTCASYIATLLTMYCLPMKCCQNFSNVTASLHLNLTFSSQINGYSDSIVKVTMGHSFQILVMWSYLYIKIWHFIHNKWSYSDVSCALYIATLLKIDNVIFCLLNFVHILLMWSHLYIKIWRFICNGRL